MSNELKISVIGAGALGGAVVEGLRRRDVDVTVFDTNPERQSAMADLGATVTETVSQAIEEADLIFWALKPHLILPAIREQAPLLSDRFCCSLAACVDLALLDQAAPDARWARAMTNICAGVCRAFTGYAVTEGVSEDDRALLEESLTHLGLVRSMAEADLDGIIGVAGSGPAYVFTVLEAFIQGGLASGLRADVSLEAAAMTLIGSAELVLQGGEHPAVYKDRVCTPAGTTIEALRVIEAGGLRTALIDGVVTACERGRTGAQALRHRLQEDSSR
ncbi:MAG: pyrroline-5-carboxylate reductase [Dethiosulfovibrio peptidovorans]|nr:MAG: pyrroline-5-carboxylate reductase [Dethiosulfovibrio peptidovorans]